MATINLLPPEFKENIYYSKKNIQAIRKLWIVFIAISILGLTFFALYKFLSADLYTIKKDVIFAEGNIASYGDLEKDAKKLSEHLSTIEKIQNDYPYFSKILSEITSLLPKNSNLTYIKLFKNTKDRVSITGLAENKRAVAIFREALENSSLFSDVDIEAITVDVQTTKEKFTISLTLEKDSLKK